MLAAGGNFDNLWRRAETKMPEPKPVVLPKPEPVEVVFIRQQRNQTKRDVLRERTERLIQKAKAYADEPEGPATWTWLAHGPGFGKSTCVRKGLRGNMTWDSRTLIAAPTKNLVAEHEAAIISDIGSCAEAIPEVQAQHFEMLRKRTKVWTSFADACQDERRRAYGVKHAKHASPRATVCGPCPLSALNGGTCGYPVQQKDATPGITIAPSAHLTNTLQRYISGSKKDFEIYIADESILGTLLPTEGITWPLDTSISEMFGLGSRRKRVKRKNANGTNKSAADLLNDPGTPLTMATLGMIGWRESLLTACRKGHGNEHGFVMAADVAAFTAEVTVTDRDKSKRQVPGYVAAIEAEQEHISTLTDMLENIQRAHMESKFDLKAVVQHLKRDAEELARWREMLNSPELSPKDCAQLFSEMGTADIAEQIDLSRFLVSCYRAIGLAAQHKRDRVLGLNILAKDGTAFIRCQLMSKLPPAMAGRDALFLDGTIHPLLADAFAAGVSPKPKVEFIRDQLEPGPYVLNQYAVIGGGSMFEGDGKDYRSSVARLWRFLQHEVVEARQRLSEPVVIEEWLVRNDSKSGKVLRRKHLLLICVPELADKLYALGLPDDVGFLTYGSLRGIDAYRHIRTLVQVGRLHPDLWPLEMMTEGVFAHMPEVRDVPRSPAGEWPVVWEDVTDLQGRTMRVQRERHSNPQVEAVRSTISDSEVIQGFARLRPDDRTSETAFVAHVFSTVELPLQPTQWLRVVDAERGPVSFMWQRGLVCRHPDELAAMELPGGAGLGTKRLEVIGTEAWAAHEALGWKLPCMPTNEERGERGSVLCRDAREFPASAPTWRNLSYRAEGARGPARVASYNSEMMTEAAAVAELSRLNGIPVRLATPDVSALPLTHQQPIQPGVLQ